MDYVKKVQDLSLSGDLSENWRKFKQNYDIFEIATEINTKKSEIRVASFLNAVGEKAVDLFQTFNLTEKERKSYDAVIKAFERHFIPRKRIIYERFLFFTRTQGKTEPFDSYLNALKLIVADCDFGDDTPLLLRDRIVSGVFDMKLQNNMLKDEKLSLDKAIEMARMAEIVLKCRAAQIETMDTASSNNKKFHSAAVTRNRPENTVSNSGSRSQRRYQQKQRNPRGETNYQPNNTQIVPALLNTAPPVRQVTHLAADVYLR